MMRIGVDVGGTNTDAVVMRGREVVGFLKVPTTADVMSGVASALSGVIAATGISGEQVRLVVIGTTQFTNALVERRQLSRTAAVRLCLPAAACLPPAIDWPEDLRQAIDLSCHLAKGGCEFDGRPISPLDPEEIARIGREIQAKGIGAIAVTGIFSPIDPSMEHQAAVLLAKVVPGVRIACSSDIGRVSLLQRENAAILNASLLALAERTMDAFAAALRRCGLACPFFVSQNDGTLMAAEAVRRLPILTVASGPTNSMRGAAFLTGMSDAIVVDVGGTTSDIGLLRRGFPREATTTVEVGGVATNFRMPDVLSIGVGGGSRVVAEGGGVAIGPASVGYRITEEALVFGGSTLTATDVMVALGQVRLGEPQRVAHLDPALLHAAQAGIEARLGAGIERMRMAGAPLPVIGVGGGSLLLPARIAGLAVTRPAHAEVANAVGAAIAQVSGEVDEVVSMAGAEAREAALARAGASARQRALEAGAAAETLAVMEQEEVPLAYLPGQATRIRVKVVGEMRL